MEGDQRAYKNSSHQSISRRWKKLPDDMTNIDSLAWETPIATLLTIGMKEMTSGILTHEELPMPTCLMSSLRALAFCLGLGVTRGRDRYKHPQT